MVNAFCMLMAFSDWVKFDHTYDRCGCKIWRSALEGVRESRDVLNDWV